MNYVILDEEEGYCLIPLPEEKDILNYNNLLARFGGCYRTEEQAKEDELLSIALWSAAGRWILCGVSEQ